MTAPSPDLVRAVRAGCNRRFPDFDCSYPHCSGICAFPQDLRAALAELTEPSKEMIDAGRAATGAWLDLPLKGIELEREKFRIRWRAIMRKVLGSEP